MPPTGTGWSTSAPVVSTLIRAKAGASTRTTSTIAQAFASTNEPVVSRTEALVASKADQKNYETVHFPGGQVTSYVPAWGLADPAVLAAGRAASSTAMTAAPYSGPRQPVMTAT